MANSVIYKIVTVLTLFIWGVLSGSISSAEITGWQDLGGGRARLVTVYDPQIDLIEGIIDVELKPGWVTYWRNPGESGIPPSFDFSSSSGIVVGVPDFPVPVTKKDAGIISIVYKNHVSFPFKAKPVISPLSGNLKLELLMGVCEVICIPAIASLSQDLTKLNRSDLISNQMIKVAKRKIPVTTRDNPDWPAILTAVRESQSAVVITTQIPETAKRVELFAEGNASWFFYPATLRHRKNNVAVFELSLDGLPKDADLSITPLRLTLASDGIGVERSIIVDEK